jgi:hypothetical protein
LAAAEKLARAEVRKKAEDDAAAKVQASLANADAAPTPAETSPRKYSNEGPASRSH